MTHATTYKRHERPGGGIPLWEIVTVDTSHTPMHGMQADCIILDDVLPGPVDHSVLARWFAARLKGPEGGSHES